MPKLNLDTPIESYRIGKDEVFVKRDDLMGNNRSLPPWGKMLGIKKLLKAQEDTSKPIIHLNVFGSWSGWALSALAKPLDIPIIIVHPNTKKIKDEYLDLVSKNGAELRPIRHNMMRVLFSQVGKMAEAEGFQRMPVAFNDEIYHRSMRRRMRAALEELEHVDSLVVSSGSGVTISGLASEFFRFNPKGRLYTSCVSSEDSVRRVLRQFNMDDKRIHVEKSEFAFDDVMKDYDVPFPCNQSWDKKAWHMIDTNRKMIRGKRTLFWNLGGINTFI